MRAVVYIAHPLRGDWDGNQRRARSYIDLALEMGYAPVAPYLMGASLNEADPRDRQTGIAWDLAVVERCDEIWLCGDRISEGMRAEADHAEAHGIPVYRLPSIEAGRAYLDNRLAL